VTSYALYELTTPGHIRFSATLDDQPEVEEAAMI
jgi:hypothetical protein